MKRLIRRVGTVVLALGCVAIEVNASAENKDGGVSRLAAMSLEDLADIEISSVSKRTEKRSAAAAAIHVITAEDIRRSTATNLSGLLRMVPGVHVAAIDTSARSVSVRGFGGRYANKLLVLVDGRSVYTPLFSGVVWEALDIPLESIERIEVIRGPGGTLWGANAVNGVINVITKSAADTQGGLVRAGAGTEYPGIGEFRYGNTAGESGHYRLQLRYLGQDDGASYRELRSDDDAVQLRGGMRFDWDWGDSQFTLIGDLYGAQNSQIFDVASLVLPLNDPLRSESYLSGGSLLGRWSQTRASGGQLRVQAYYDRAESNNFFLDEDRYTLDIEVQYQLAPKGRHELMWGAGYRYYHIAIGGTPLAFYDPTSQGKQLFSAFVQDRISFFDDRLALTLGTKIEHNDFTGIEIQPSIRLAWTPNDRHTLWAAVSRAVHTPSVTDESTNVVALGLPGAILTFAGDEDFDSEDLIAFELGYRIDVTERLSMDLALFYNIYDNLRTTEIDFPYVDSYPRPVHFAIPALGRNNMEATVYGGELAVDWQALSWWRLHMSYTYLEMNLEQNPVSVSIAAAAIEGDSPQQQVYLRSHMDLSDTVEFDVNMRYVDELPALGIDDYFSLDARVSWHPNDRLELTLVGHDLLESKHLEYDSMFVITAPTQVQRGIYGLITWRF